MAEPLALRRSLRIEWKVKNIFEVNKLKSQDFSFCDTSCKFRLGTIGSREGKVIFIHLSRINSNKTFPNGISVKMFTEDRNRKPQYFMERNIGNAKDLVWAEYVSGLRKNEETLFTNGILTFVCELTETNGEDKIGRDMCIKTAVNLETVANLERLSLDFHHLLEDSFLSDCTLQCGDNSIRAHKNILCARSEVFLAMFRNDMAESRTGIIEISDMEPSTLDRLMQYIYSGKVPELSVDSAQQLYAAADKYVIDSLKRLCGNFLKENLTGENACSSLALADTHGDKDIKDYILSFIMETELLRDEDHWLKFLKEHPTLATEVIHLVYREKCSLK